MFKRLEKLNSNKILNNKKKSSSNLIENKIQNPNKNSINEKKIRVLTIRFLNQ